MVGIGWVGLVFASGATAGMLSADLRVGPPTAVVLESAVDDAQLANPPGYFSAELPVERIVEQIVIENTGKEAIRNPDVRLNGRPLLPLADPLATLGVEDETDLLALYAAWRDRRVHATTGLTANRDPFEVLHALGATFCGEDSRALGTISLLHGAEVRFPRLHGHSAAEHRLRGDWMLLDGDQNAFYLRWDNRTAAASADVMDDPLLALRTKVYGRQAKWEAAAAWQNAARFDLRERDQPMKILRIKRLPVFRDWELLPGESLVIYPGRPPERVHGANEDLCRNAALRNAACLVEFHPDIAARGGRVRLPFPRLSAAPGEPVGEVTTTEERVFCQAARAQFPPLLAGRNELLLASAGSLRVSFDARSSHRVPTPPPVVAKGADAACFTLAAKDSDRMWWQIGLDRRFRIVPPAFDRVETFQPEAARRSRLDDTFLSPGHEYFFRAKVRRDGVWSAWSAPLAFVVKKPAAPRLEEVTRSSREAVRVRWTPMPGEMLIFGSERLDFLPEIYGEEEPTQMENGVIRAHRPNRNLLATVPADRGEALVPERAAYRLIAREAGKFSVPSALRRLPGVPARALQNRHEKPPGALTGRDVAVEMVVP